MTHHRLPQAGFTLLELMITVAIVGILAAIAYPGYTEYVAKSRRADAKSALLETAQWLERNYTVSNTYDVAAANIPASYRQSPKTGTAYYDISLVRDGTAPSPDNAQFTLQAVPASVMSNDRCGSFRVTNAGVRSLNGNISSADVPSCWGR